MAAPVPPTAMEYELLRLQHELAKKDTELAKKDTELVLAKSDAKLELAEKLADAKALATSLAFQLRLAQVEFSRALASKAMDDEAPSYSKVAIDSRENLGESWRNTSVAEFFIHLGADNDAVAAFAEVGNKVATKVGRIIPTAAKREKNLQEKLDHILRKAYKRLSSAGGGVPPLSLEIVGTSNKVLLGRRSPDFCGFLLNETLMAPSTVVVLGELKAVSSDKLSVEHQGQLLSCLRKLCRLQAGRRLLYGEGKAVGFGCNETHIAFMSITMKNAFAPELVSVTTTLPVPWSEGAKYLLCLSSLNLTHLGFMQPSLTLVPGRPAVPVGRYLGRGATAAGFEVQCKEGLAVAKIFHSTSPAELAALELEILTNVNRNLGGRLPRGIQIVRAVIDQVVDASAGRKALVLMPAGIVRYAMPGAGRLPPTGFICPTAAEFCALVQALALMHTAGYVHRDPRPENCFRDAQGTFILGDLGFATSIGEVPDALQRDLSYRYGPLDALTAADGRYSHFPFHDFEQVARLVFAAAVGLDIPRDADGEALSNLWERYSRCSGLLRLLEAARRAADGGEEGRRMFMNAIKEELPDELTVGDQQAQAPGDLPRAAVEDRPDRDEEMQRQ